jgi:hypothetical protein
MVWQNGALDELLRHKFELFTLICIEVLPRLPQVVTDLQFFHIQFPDKFPGVRRIVPVHQ